MLSFGVGKFSIALILGYNGFSAYLLTFHRRCQLTAQPKMRAFVLVGPFLLSEVNSIKHLKI